MITKNILRFALTGTIAFCLINVHAQKTRQPNIIVILADDMGYADLGVQGFAADVKTPHLDSLARAGVRFTNGYVTAPQCSPSRAGLLTGRYQQRFGFDEIPTGPLPLEEITLADRLKKAGYRTGMVGKWHLEPNAVTVKWAKTHLPDAPLNKEGRLSAIPMGKRIPYMPAARGFDEFFTGELNHYWTNFDFGNGTLLDKPGSINLPGFRIDLQTEAAKQFISRQKTDPFFLYLPYFGPHVPLEATKKYLDRFPGDMPERRRYALAMIAAIDDGVGELCALLKAKKLDKNTIIIFTSDNGAPLGITKADVDIHNSKGAWDGSLNTPLLGEKGMLSEGGIRVPFLMAGAGIPKGKVFNDAVSTLDIVPTCLAMAGSSPDARLDGANLLPFLTGRTKALPHENMYWRFWTQSAIRSGNYKFISAGNAGSYLFDLGKDPEEKNNIIAQQPELAKQLRQTLEMWTTQLQPPGIPNKNLREQEVRWYNHYLEKIQ